MPRPGFHVTAPTGWINDPLGVTWHAGGAGEPGRYELFVQYNPAGTDWAPACHWGQLSSPDLVRWEWVGVALRPRPHEAGCWSGSVAVRDDGVPVIVYTSVPEENLDHGRVALATGDPGWRSWTPDPGGPVLPGPPPGHGITHFRDPYVWRSVEGWRMAIGGGQDDGQDAGRAVALQYSSPDLRHWTLDGVLADRPADRSEPIPTGSVWECVQFFPLGGRWVLLVSVWADGEPQRMAAAVGDYDGHRFAPRAWQRFTATDSLYAATTFLDAEGRRCAISWFREPGAAGEGWAGLLGVPVVLALEGDRVVPAPHPALDSLRGPELASLAETRLGREPVVIEPVGVGAVGPFIDLVLAAADGPVRIGVRATEAEVMALFVDPAADAVVLSRPGRHDERVPLGPDASGDVPLRLLLDAGIAEVFTAVDAGAVGVAFDGSAVSLDVTAPGGAALLRRLTAWAMPRG